MLFHVQQSVRPRQDLVISQWPTPVKRKKSLFQAMNNLIGSNVMEANDGNSMRSIHVGTDVSEDMLNEQVFRYNNECAFNEGDQELTCFICNT